MRWAAALRASDSTNWRVQPEGIPPLGAPSLTDPGLLQNNMVEAAYGQRGAHSEARGSRAHDCSIHHGWARHDD